VYLSVSGALGFLSAKTPIFFLHLVVIDCFENYSVVICGQDCYLNSEIIDADGMGQKEQQQPSLLF
jgi:hypothetical protein